MTEKRHFQGECRGGVVESHWKQGPGGSVPMSRALQELCRALCCHSWVLGTDGQTDRQTYHHELQVSTAWGPQLFCLSSCPAWSHETPAPSVL